MFTRYILFNRLFCGVIIIMTLCGCGGQKRKEGFAAIQRVQAAVHEMSVVVTVGVNQAEFTHRLTDALLKVGDIQEDEKIAVSKFPERDRQPAGQVYRHLRVALASYNESKNFFGDDHKGKLDPWDGDFRFTQAEYDTLGEQFPGIQELFVQTRGTDIQEYWKGDMLQALWKYAATEDQKARSLVDQLNRK
jgi:hypothetical protein